MRRSDFFAYYAAGIWLGAVFNPSEVKWAIGLTLGAGAALFGHWAANKVLETDQ